MNTLFSISLKDLKSSRKRGRKSILNDYFNKYIIYCWEINNKRYIGLSSNISVRLKNYLSNSSSDHYISRALAKYDDEDILFSILEICESEKELLEREKYYISKYNTLENGYNLTTGGEDFKISDVTRTKMINSAKNKKQVFFVNVNTGKIEHVFESVRASARFFKSNPSSIFAAIRVKNVFNNKFKVGYDEEHLKCNYLPKKHENNKIMLNNRNGTRYVWVLTYTNGVEIVKDSIKKMSEEINMNYATLRRISEGKMKNDNFNFKLKKYDKREYNC